MNVKRDKLQTTVYLTCLPQELYFLESDSVPNCAVSCRDIMRMYSQGVPIPVMQGAQYDSEPRQAYVPSDHLEALQMVNDFTSEQLRKLSFEERQRELNYNENVSSESSSVKSD